MEFVPIALACGCVIVDVAHYDVDLDRTPRMLVECENGHGWQSFVAEPEREPA